MGDQVLGALSIRTQREEGFSAEDVSIATAFAAQAAIGLENARLYQQSEARAENLRALSRLTILIFFAEGGKQVCQAVARAATTLLGAATTRVSVADPVARVLRTEGGFSLDPEIELIVTEVPTVRYGEGLSGRIVETRRPEYIPDIADVPQLKNRRLSSVARLRGFAGLPLIADDEIVGVLAMFFHERRSFSAEERELMALLADQAAIAIRNARLRQALRTRQAHLETLLEVSRQLSKIQPVESLLTTIAEACGRLLDSDTVGFRRVDGDELIHAGSWGDARNVMITERLRMGESLAGRVAVGGEPLVVTDLANDPRVTPAHRASFHSRGYQALLVIPVKVGERVIGVLSVLSRRDEGFSAEDVMIATAFAAQAAVALENSRLYQEIQRAYDELSQTQDQLAQASKMEAVGHLAGGVAHDFNNLLMVIMGRADVVLRGLDAKHSMRPAIQDITRTAQRAADLTHQLLAFSRKQVLKPAVLDLNSVIANLTEMLRRLIGEDIDLVAVLDPALGRAKADLGQIEQIVMNLAVNARDAMPHGGQLTLETANVELDAEYARMRGVRPVRMSCSPSATPASEWIRRPRRASLSRSSPPRARARAPASASPWSMASSSRAAATSESTASPGRERPSRSIFRRSTSRSTAAPRARRRLLRATARRRCWWSRTKRESARWFATFSSRAAIRCWRPVTELRRSKSRSGTRDRFISSSPTWSCRG